MGLFRFGTFGIGSIILGEITKNIAGKTLGINTGPTLVEKVDLILSDAEFEGKSMGYVKASKEYKEAFKDIEKWFENALESFKSMSSNYKSKSKKMISELENLENQKKELERKLETKKKDFSIKYNIPINNVSSAMRNGSLFDLSASMFIFDVVYKHNEKTYKEAEQNGYLEAKKIYDIKIKKMLEELDQFANKGNAEINELLSLINELVRAIADEQSKIVELNILLGETHE